MTYDEFVAAAAIAGVHKSDLDAELFLLDVLSTEQKRAAMLTRRYTDGDIEAIVGRARDAAAERRELDATSAAALRAQEIVRDGIAAMDAIGYAEGSSHLERAWRAAAEGNPSAAGHFLGFALSEYGWGCQGSRDLGYMLMERGGWLRRA